MGKRMVVGLGNPGAIYEGTRHNLGFEVVDRLAQSLGQNQWKKAQHALTINVPAKGLLVKPWDFINNSGVAVAKLLNWYGIELAECLVISDDLDMAVGAVRQRSEGSSGGHKGLVSITAQIGSSAFNKLRIGIGKPPDKRLTNAYVLGKPSANASSEESKALSHATMLAIEQAQLFLDGHPFENWSYRPKA